MKRRMLIALIIYYYLAVIALHVNGIAYYAYPCIDTLPNGVCDVMLSLLTW